MKQEKINIILDADDTACADNAGGLRLDKALADRLPDMTRSRLQRLCSQGMITKDGRPLDKKYIPKPGDEICVLLPPPEESEAAPEEIPLDVVYEDGDLLVVNKPKGMVVHPAAGHSSGTLVNALLHHCGGSLSGVGGVLRPGIVHRIDKDTSGLLVVAKNDFAHNCLTKVVKAHDFTRQYDAIVVGCPKDERGTVNAPIARHKTDRKKMAVMSGGREAVTHYEVVGRYRGYSHLKLMLETGRTHQIRVHMAYIGHPVVCDTVYGGKKPQFDCCSGQCLHASRIAFAHPRTGKVIDFTAPLPDYFKQILERIT
ncbi:MAG: RluA family pseudouridine synthase [Oscillospiraceae bacterium]|nr:RluA family pseudouridine synthase [Oscillospiraceae bacterium]